MAKTVSAQDVVWVTEGLGLGGDEAKEVEEDGRALPAPLPHADPAIACAMEQTRTE